MPRQRKLQRRPFGSIPLQRPRRPDLGQCYGDSHLHEVFMWNGRRWTAVTRIISLPWQTWVPVLGSVTGPEPFQSLPPDSTLTVEAYVARVASLGGLTGLENRLPTADVQQNLWEQLSLASVADWVYRAVPSRKGRGPDVRDAGASETPAREHAVSRHPTEGSDQLVLLYHDDDPGNHN